MKPIPLSVLAVTAIVLAGACSRTGHAGALHPSQASQVDALFAEWNGTDAPGCAVGISRDGAIVYEHGYGMANLERHVPITPDTVFAVASVTKAFTAMSVLLAAERGRLTLDEEVQKYIPDWQDRQDHITIRHLITHTSGIRDAFGLLGWADPKESAGDINEDIVRMLARQRGVNFPPGSEYQYNNGGYNLLASILKRATGQSLRQFAEANIFTPLGMSHTQVVDEASIVVANRASGYTREASGWSAAKNQGAGPVGNDGMYSTVGDLLRWEDNFGTPKVGAPETLAAMQKPTVVAGHATTSGMGVGLDTYRGLPSLAGSGGSWGVASKFARFPNQHLSIAVLCNEDNVVMGGRARVNPDVFTNGIADIYLADAAQPAAADAAAPKAVQPQTPVKLTDAELAEKTGLYAIGDTGFPGFFSVDHGTLMVRSYYADDFDFELVPVVGTRFLLRGNVPFEFIPARPGHTQEWHVGDGKDARVWPPVEYAVSPAALEAYAGDFRSDELRVTYAIARQRSGLTVSIKGGAPGVAIAPFSKDVFVGDWVGIVRFTRDARGTVTGFTVNRINARGVGFDRVTRVR
jgi:CubicO group peptidase (beta-lactamase class C family)